MFLDCQSHGCGRTEFRTEIGWVDWVREASASDVHVIFTSQSTGADSRYILDFIGRGELRGMDFEVGHVVPGTATSDERLRLVTRAFRAGLVPYATRFGYADRLDIRSLDDNGVDSRPPADDPWDFWVFTLSGSAQANGEERESAWRLFAQASASRITPAWKIEGVVRDFD